MIDHAQTAVVRETLRISSPAISPVPRVVPPDGARVKGNFIPGGVSHFFTQCSTSQLSD